MIPKLPKVDIKWNHRNKLALLKVKLIGLC